MNTGKNEQDEPEEKHPVRKLRSLRGRPGPGRAIFRAIRGLILVGLLVCSLALNVATVAVGSVAAIASNLFEAATGTVSVLGQRDRDLRVERDRVKKLDTDLRDEKDRVKKLDTDVEAFRRKEKDVSKKVAATVKRISRRTVAAETRNIAATFGEGLPVVGIGVIVAVTGMELYDACATMKELHALDVAFNPQNANDAGVNEVCGMQVPTAEELWSKVRASPGEAWRRAKEAVPDLPEMPTFEMPTWPEVDWTFWN